MNSKSGRFGTGTVQSKGYPSSEKSNVHARPTLRSYRESVSPASGATPSQKPATKSQGKNTTPR